MRKTKFNLEDFNKFYFMDKLSVREIASRFGLNNKSGLSYYVNKHNISLRTKSEAAKLAYINGKRNIKGKNNPNYKHGKLVGEMIGKRWNKYGITEEEFQIKLNKQNNKCAICNMGFIETPRIDHDHETGNVRGLLCNSCNGGLGLFKDNLELITKALSYLLEWSGHGG